MVLFDKAAATLIAFPPGSAVSNYTVPSTVKDIAVNAFAFAGSLTNVLIPASVTNIDVDAFLSCANFKTAYCEGAAPSGDDIRFSTGHRHRLLFAGNGRFGPILLADCPPRRGPLPYPTILSDGNGSRLPESKAISSASTCRGRRVVQSSLRRARTSGIRCGFRWRRIR